jgi:hypothetical protein
MIRLYAYVDSGIYTDFPNSLFIDSENYSVQFDYPADKVTINNSNYRLSSIIDTKEITNCQSVYKPVVTDIIIPDLEINIRRISERYLVNRAQQLFVKWQSKDLRFLFYNPEIWLFRYNKRNSKFIDFGDSTENYLRKKKFRHPAPNPKENSNFYGGGSANFFYKPYLTEFPIETLSGKEFQIPINISDFFYKKSIATNEHVEIQDDYEYLDQLEYDVFAYGQRKSVITAALAIVIDNPDVASNTKKIFSGFNVFRIGAFKTGTGNYQLGYSLKN